MTLALAVAFLAAAAAPAPRPNVVFIMADDHAAHAISRLRLAGQPDPEPRPPRPGGDALRERLRHELDLHAEPRRDPDRRLLPQERRARLQPLRRLADDGGQAPAGRRLPHRHDRQVAPRAATRPGFDRWEILPGQGVYHDPVLYTATGERTYTGRYVTDVITDLGIDFIRERPKDRPFFLMLHHKAPHREWTPDEKHRRMFERRTIPEAPTLWDDYATRTDALRENQQRVADDLTRRDLKLEPPPGLDGARTATRGSP